MLMPFSCSSSSPANGWAARQPHSSWSNSMHLWCWLSSNIFKRAGVTALPHETHVWLLSSHLCTSLNTDRKSTRLNSSHGYISYAVFCLKKKKKQRNNNYNHIRKRLNVVLNTRL